MNLMDTLKASGFGASYEFGFMSIAVQKAGLWGKSILMEIADRWYTWMNQCCWCSSLSWIVEGTPPDRNCGK